MSTHRYDDIINMEHHVSTTRQPMSMSDRAAQFSAFAALNGYEDSISETARLTDPRLDMDPDAVAILDRKMHHLLAHAHEGRPFTIVFFEPDKKKAGGAYVTVSDSIRKIDDAAQSLITSGGIVIPFSSIVDIVQ